MSPRWFPAALALFALAAAACGSAVAAPAPRVPAAGSAPAAPAAGVPESLAIVRRISARPADAVPNLVGQDAATARSKAQRAGVTLTIIRMAPRARTVSSQWPAAGASAAGEGLIVWLGRPVAPRTAQLRPPAQRTTAAKPAAKPAGAGAQATASTGSPVLQVPVMEPPVETGPDNPKTSTGQPVTSPVSGSTPGLETFVPPPHGPRTNIRTLPPAPAGQKMAGRASWYGPGFDGHQTACGGIFSASGLTIASRELRCGTTVTVTGPSGSARATVTDWGPAEWTQRRFDLSQATFDAVASLGSGVIDVTVTVTG